jgi:hypothetical protein
MQQSTVENDRYGSFTSQSSNMTEPRISKVIGKPRKFGDPIYRISDTLTFGAAIPSIKILMHAGRPDIMARCAAGTTSSAFVTSSP